MSTSTLRLPQVRAERGTVVSVPVILDAAGGEAGIGFSIDYQVLGLANPHVSLGSEGQGWTLTVNPNLPGKIGVLLDTDPLKPLTPGSKHMVTIAFDVLPTALDANGLEFSSTPISLSTADYMANDMPTLYQNGDVLIGNASAPSRPILPLGYFGSYTPPGSLPNNTDPLYIEPPDISPIDGGPISAGGVGNPTGPAPATDGTIFGLSPLVVAALVAVGLYIWSES